MHCYFPIITKVGVYYPLRIIWHRI